MNVYRPSANKFLNLFNSTILNQAPMTNYGHNNIYITPADIYLLNEYIKALLPKLILEEIQYIITEISTSDYSDYLEDFLVISLQLYNIQNKLAESQISSIITNIFSLNSIKNSLLNRMFIFLLDYLNTNNSRQLYAIFFYVIISENKSKRFKRLIPALLNKYLQNNPSMINAFEENTVKFSSSIKKNLFKQISFLRCLVLIQYHKPDIPIFNDNLIWNLISQTLYNAPIIEYRTIFSNLRKWGLNFPSLDLMLNKIIYNLPFDLKKPKPVSIIMGKFLRAMFQEYPFDVVIHLILKWYKEEPVSDFRYAFHLNYISVIQNEGFPSEAMLNYTSEFVYTETDIQVLIRVWQNLKEFNSWKTLNYLVTRILDLQVINEEPESISSKIFQRYLLDLSEDFDLLSETQEIFIQYWKMSPNANKHKLFLQLKTWVEESQSTSPTIKGVLVQSLKNQTTDDHHQWEHLLSQLLLVLGPLRVTILDDLYNQKTTISISDSSESVLFTPEELLESVGVVIHCIGCRTQIKYKEQTQCQSCLGIFCKNCYKIWKTDYTSDINNKTCLGTILYGFQHQFNFSTISPI